MGIISTIMGVGSTRRRGRGGRGGCSSTLGILVMLMILLSGLFMTMHVVVFVQHTHSQQRDLQQQQQSNHHNNNGQFITMMDGDSESTGPSLHSLRQRATKHSEEVLTVMASQAAATPSKDVTIQSLMMKISSNNDNNHNNTETNTVHDASSEGTTNIESHTTETVDGHKKVIPGEDNFDNKGNESNDKHGENKEEQSSSSSSSSLNEDIEDTDSISGGGGGGDDPDVDSEPETSSGSKESIQDRMELSLTLYDNDDDDNTITRQKRRRPKILWGIASAYQDDTETRRREAIRASYLSFYKSNDHFVTNVDRICSLVDVLERNVDFDRCQLVYTFFMGGNMEGPEELMNVENPSQYVVPDLSKVKKVERDATYLNIKENQFGGKMQTWFAYAHSLIQQGYHFDYVAKVDSDTMLYTPTFLSAAQKLLPVNATRIFAGVSVSRKHCGRKKDEHCSKMVKDWYIGGNVEMMSADLVKHVASLTYDDRRRLEIESHEDITIGNFVLSHPEEVTKVELGAPIGYMVRKQNLKLPMYWRHDRRTKAPGKMLRHWLKYEHNLRQQNPLHDSVLVLYGSDYGARQVEAVMKHRCSTTKFIITERCLKSFDNKSELFLSRLSSNATSIPNGQLWEKPVIVSIQNPINAYLLDWMTILTPYSKEKNFEATRNQDLLNQIQRVESTSKIYMIRAEHVWNDLLQVEKILGNPNVESISPKDWPAISDPAVEIVSSAARDKTVSIAMCCALREEIHAYHQILDRIDRTQWTSDSLRAAKEETLAMCRITSIDDLHRHCTSESTK